MPTLYDKALILFWVGFRHYGCRRPSGAGSLAGVRTIDYGPVGQRSGLAAAGGGRVLKVILGWSRCGPVIFVCYATKTVNVDS